MKLNQLTQYIQRSYPYITDVDIQIMIDCATDILLDTLYPFNEEITEVPQRKVSWIYRCVIEQIERKGMSSVTSYRENGIQVTFDRTSVSQGLINQLLPLVGV